MLVNSIDFSRIHGSFISCCISQHGYASELPQRFRALKCGDGEAKAELMACHGSHRKVGLEIPRYQLNIAMENRALLEK